MTNDKRVWVKGKPVRGFFGGLAFGLGVALVAHAFKLVAFEDRMFTYWPLATAILFAVRAQLGSAFRVKVSDEAEAGHTPPEAPPSPEPVPES